jgi:uncharacterized protein YxeA
MKKILITLFALICVNILSAQMFLRASGLIIGTKSQYTTTVNWGDAKPVNILIKVEENKVSIFSKTTQVYRKISLSSKTDLATTYYCSDATGNNCNLTVFVTLDNPGAVYLHVEYSDMVWMYVSRIE